MRKQFKLWQILAHALESVGARRLALRYIEKAIAANPNRTDLHIQASRLFLKNGQVDRAALHCKKASIGFGPGSFLCWLDKASNGSYLYQQIDTDSSIPVENSDEKDLATTLNNSGLLLLSEKRFLEALACFKQALKLSRKDPVILINIGLVYSKMGEYQQALEVLEIAQQLKCSSLELLVQKGYNLFHLKRYEEAVTCYELARQMSPEDPDVLGNLGSCYQQLGKYEKAVDCYNIALAVNSQNATLYNNMALCLERLNQLDEAIKCYCQAVEIDTTDVLIMTNYAACLGKIGQHSEACKLCDQVLQMQPDNYQAWGVKGNLLMDLDRPKEAAEAFAKALGIAS